MAQEIIELNNLDHMYFVVIAIQLFFQVEYTTPSKTFSRPSGT